MIPESAQPAAPDISGMPGRGPYTQKKAGTFMKHILPILLSLLLIFAMLSGCVKKTGGEGSPAADAKPTAEGTYILKTINGETVEEQFKSMEEEGMSMEDILSLFGITSVDEYFTLELKADGTLLSLVAGEDPETGTWKQEGEKIIVDFDGEAVEMTLNGNEISFTEDDQAYVFVKK